MKTHMPRCGVTAKLGARKIIKAGSPKHDDAKSIKDHEQTIKGRIIKMIYRQLQLQLEKKKYGKK